MALTRVCDGCDEVIVSPNFYDVSLSTKKTNGPETQDPIKSDYGEFCRKCVESGKALDTLMTSVKNDPS